MVSASLLLTTFGTQQPISVKFNRELKVSYNYILAIFKNQHLDSNETYILVTLMREMLQ